MTNDEVQKIHALGDAAQFVVAHERFQGLPPAAAWLWLRALVDLRTSNSGGLIVAHKVRLWGATRAASVLVEHGLWRFDAELNGWRFRPLSSTFVRPAPQQIVTGHVVTSPEVLRFKTVGQPAEWALTQAHVDTWTRDFPGLDILAECRHANAWVTASPSRRKTARGMPAFLVRWFGRAIDRRRAAPVSSGRTGAAPADKYAGMVKRDD